MSADESTDTLQSKKSSPMLAIILVVIFGVAGSAGGYFMAKKKSTAEIKKLTDQVKASKKHKNEDHELSALGIEEEEDDEGEHVEDDEALEKQSVVMPIESFLVNLQDGATSRYLKVTIELDLAKPLDDIKSKRVSRFRDAVLMHLSALTVESLQKPESKKEIKKVLLKLARAVFGRSLVRALYYKEFVMQ